MLSYVDQSPPAAEPPPDALALRRWLVDTLSRAAPGDMAAAVREAEIVAGRRFPAKLVVHTLRQVLTEDLLGRD